RRQRSPHGGRHRKQLPGGRRQQGPHGGRSRERLSGDLGQLKACTVASTANAAKAQPAMRCSSFGRIRARILRPRKTAIAATATRAQNAPRATATGSPKRAVRPAVASWEASPSSAAKDRKSVV